MLGLHPIVESLDCILEANNLGLKLMLIGWMFWVFYDTEINLACWVLHLKDKVGHSKEGVGTSNEGEYWRVRYTEEVGASKLDGAIGRSLEGAHLCKALNILSYCQFN